MLQAAACDRRLTGWQLRVLVYLSEEISTEPRPVKQAAVAHALRMSSGMVSRAIQRLVRLGYLDRGVTAGTFARRDVSPSETSRGPLPLP